MRFYIILFSCFCFLSLCAQLGLCFPYMFIYVDIFYDDLIDKLVSILISDEQGNNQNYMLGWAEEFFNNNSNLLIFLSFK